jgi:hypothetical protein
MDACALVGDPHRLLSTSHLVGHLIREIEASLRDVLRPLAQVAGTLEEPEDDEDRSTHKDQIRSILVLLDIPLENEVARKWLSQAGTYQGRVHRPALGAPRPFGPAFSIYFDDFESILDYVLNRMEANYAWVFVRVDDLAAKSPAQKADLDLLLTSVPQDVVALGRFFERVSDPSWLRLIRERGMFGSPPEPEINFEEGTVSFPPWPQSHFLVRMAPEVPDDVVEIVNNIPPTDNIYANAAIVDVARAVPIGKVDDLVPRLITALNAKYRMVFPFRMAELIGELSGSGDHTSAMELARAILSFEEQPLPPEEDANSARLRSIREPRLRVEEHLYGEILQRQVPRLVQAVGMPALDMLASLLEEAIVISSSEEMIEGHIDFSSIWCREVAPEGLSNDLGMKTHLTSALRDASVSRVEAAPRELRLLVESLEARQWSIFRRLALNLLRVHGAIDTSLVQERLIDPSIFSDFQLRPEYEKVLAGHFSALTEEAQLSILAMIEAEPDIDRHARWVRGMHGREPMDDETQAFVEMALLERLTPIADLLPEPWTTRYQQYLEAHGPHSSRVPPTSGGFIGERSPATAEELAGLDVDALVGYLDSFEPTGAFFDPSKTGLASRLMDVVTADPNRYLPFAERFEALDIEYVNGVLNGLVRAVMNGTEVDWDAVLGFCDTIVSKPRDPTGDEVGSRWGWTRLEVVRLLSTGLGSAHPLLPEHEDHVLSIFERISDDPHPTPADEAESSMSPEDLSLNSVRSRAIEAVLEYGVWKYRRDPGASFDEVIALVDRHLDPEVDPSLAVRFMIGRNFSNLIAFDRTWATTAAERIFPADEALRPLWSAAWDGYLWRGIHNKPTWLALENQYALAVSRIQPGTEERRQQGRDQSLANHLVNLYWAGEIGLHEGLLEDLLAVADESLRRCVLETVGRGIAQNGATIDDVVLERLVGLWNSRVDTVRSDPSGELSAFGWWFAAERVPVGQRIQGLRDALSLSGSAEPAHEVVEGLATLSAEHPRVAAELLVAMTGAEADGWRFTLWDGSASQIIKTSMASADPEAIRFAREAASRAAARGHAQWIQFLAEP